MFLRIFLNLAVTILLLSVMPNLKAQEISAINTDDVSSFTLTLTGVEEAEGEIRIAVFNSEQSYTKETVFAEIIPVHSTEVNWSIPELPYGEYAIAVYHDKNTNGELDTNLLGIPKEIYGFSNNARGRFGPASWNDARFSVTAKKALHTIHLH